MGYTVKVNHPHFPEGTIFNVGGLDRVANGESLDVDEEMERMFLMQQGQTLEDAFANDGIIDVTGSSSLDQEETDSILAQFAPVEEEEEVVETEEETPAWLQNTANEGGDT